MMIYTVRLSSLIAAFYLRPLSCYSQRRKLFANSLSINIKVDRPQYKRIFVGIVEGGISLAAVKLEEGMQTQEPRTILYFMFCEW